MSGWLPFGYDQFQRNQTQSFSILAGIRTRFPDDLLKTFLVCTSVRHDVASHAGHDRTVEGLTIHSFEDVSESIDLALVLASFPDLDRLCTKLIGEGDQARIPDVIAVL